MIQCRHLLHRALISGLAIACLALLSPMQLRAETQPELTRSDPYSDLLDAMQSGIDEATMMDNLAASVAQQLVRDAPVYSEIQAYDPTFEANLAGAVRPVLMDYSHRVHREYAPKLIGVLQRDLTAAEAANVAKFYRSELGIALLQSLSRNMASNDVLSDALDGDEISEESVEADMARSGIRTLLGLTPEQRKAINDMTSQRPELAKMNVVSANMTPVRAQMENEPLTADEQARLTTAIQRLIGEVLGEPFRDPEGGETVE